jgi:hypothetical protein
MSANNKTCSEEVVLDCTGLLHMYIYIYNLTNFCSLAAGDRCCVSENMVLYSKHIFICRHDFAGSTDVHVIAVLHSCSFVPQL